MELDMELIKLTLKNLVIFYLQYFSYLFPSESVVPVEKLSGGGCPVMSHYRSLILLMPSSLNIQSADELVKL